MNNSKKYSLHGKLFARNKERKNACEKLKKNKQTKNPEVLVKVLY